MKKTILLILAILLTPVISHGTVAESTSRIKAACNGSTTIFPYTFNASDTTEIEVIKTDAASEETVLVNGTDYTSACTNNDCSSGGSVTITDTCISGSFITILRDVDIDQESEYTEGMPALYESFSNDLDKQTRINQEQQEEIDRAVKTAKSSTLGGTAIVLPEPAANTVLQWNSAGTNLTNGDTSVTVTVPQIDYIGNYADLATAVSSIGSDPTTLMINVATVIDDGVTVTIPSTMTLWFTDGGSIDGTAGGGTETLTVNGLTTFGTNQVFGSNLTVNGSYTYMGRLHVSSIANLRTIPGSVGQYAETGGYYTSGDGGGGVFYWDSSSTTADDNGSVIKPTSITTGRWKRIPTELVDVRAFGATGNGTTDDGDELASVRTKDVFFSAGTYIVNQDITFTGRGVFAKGAIIKMTGTNTVTFSLPIEAPDSPIMDVSATSKILLINKECPAEWFGAVHSSAAADLSAVITIAQRCCKRVILKDKNYYTQTAIIINTSGFELSGLGYHWQSDSTNQTRIITPSGTEHIISILGVKTGSTSTDFVKDIVVENVDLLRLALTAPTTGDEENAPCGLRVRYAQYTRVNKVRSSDSSVGFYLAGTIRTYLTNCQGSWTGAITPTTSGSQNNIHRAIWLNGSEFGATGFGPAGGNASTYITDCTASTSSGLTGAKFPDSDIGFLITGAPVDTIVTRLETTGSRIGIHLDGTGVAAAGGVTNQFIDVHFVTCIIDTFRTHGIIINDTYAGGAISLVDCYFAATLTATTTAEGLTPVASVYILDSNSNIMLVNNQSFGGSNTGVGGLLIDTSQGVREVNGVYTNHKVNPVRLLDSASLNLEFTISNPGVTCSSSAVYMDNVDNSFIKPTTIGVVAGSYAKGVEVTGTTSSTSSDNEINFSGLNEANITAAVRGSIGDTNVVDGSRNTYIYKNLCTGVTAAQ